MLGDCESTTIAPGGGGPVPGPTAGAPLSVRVTAPATAKLARLLGGGPLKFRVTFSGACRAVAGIVVRKPEAKRLKLGSKETTIARIVSNVPAAGTFAATLTLKKKYRAKLRQATRVTAYVVVACVAADGPTPAAARKIVLRA